jgi:tetratricopeptide (TPR) repeat protein
MTGRLLPFPARMVCSDEGRAVARRILEASPSERLARARDFRLEEPDGLLSVCSCLRDQLATIPAKIRDEAEFFYRFLEKPKRPIGLFDERQYFLGEFALIAGTACRQLSRRDESRLWFDRAESGFRHTANAVGDLSRLAYQRLALRMEERQLEAVLEMAPPLVETLEKLGMPEEALKCRFLEGLALMESSQLAEAVGVFQDICRVATDLGSEKLLASAYTNLTHIYGMLGDSSKAFEASRNAIPLLKRLDDRVALAKVQWGLATLLREIGQISASVATYQAAQQEFGRIGMRADVAALSLVVADLLLESGKDQEAMREVLAALPVIDELKMVPEGVAALSLLRESLRHQKINRQALRDLHGYFEEIQK